MFLLCKFVWFLIYCCCSILGYWSQSVLIHWILALSSQFLQFPLKQWPFRTLQYRLLVSPNWYRLWYSLSCHLRLAWLAFWTGNKVAKTWAINPAGKRRIKESCQTVVDNAMKLTMIGWFYVTGVDHGITLIVLIWPKLLKRNYVNVRNVKKRIE